MSLVDLTVYTVVGAFWGDEGKAKIAHSLLEKLAGTEVTDQVLTDFPASERKKVVGIRYNGGANAGHTQVVKIPAGDYLDRLLVTEFNFCQVDRKPDGSGVLKIKNRSLPSALIVPGVSAVIGPQCVIHWETLRKEIEDMEKIGIRGIRERLFIAHNAHVVEDYHQHEDRMLEARKSVTTGVVIGTTGQGIGPCNAGKANRINRRVEDVPDFQQLGQVVNTRKLIQKWAAEGDWELVGEGAQSLMLDIDWGIYPRVTSAGTYPTGIFSVGVPMNVREMNIILTAKAYTTLVGNHDVPSYIDPKVAEAIADEGGEYGTVTKRRRRVEYLDLDYLADSIWSCRPSRGGLWVVVNKGDILSNLSDKRVFGLVQNQAVTHAPNLEAFETDLKERLLALGVDRVMFSHTPMADPEMFDFLIE